MPDDATSLPNRSAPLVLVTGSTRGIGLGVAFHLVAGGYRVIVHGRDQQRVRQAEQLSAGPGPGVVVGGVVADLTDPSAVDRLRERVVQQWGVPDGVVVNAGGSHLVPGPVEEIDPEAWDQAVRDNLSTAFLTIRAFLPAMKERGSGAIVAVSSSVTRRAHERAPAAYAAAKAGLESLIRTVAVQAGPAGIRANCVVPELIMTEGNERAIPREVREGLAAAHPIRRLGTVHDVAAGVEFLLSPSAAWITGESLGVTGGA